MTKDRVGAVAVAAGAVIVAILAGLFANGAPSDIERLQAVQDCLNSGGRQRQILACVEDAMEGWEAPPTPSPTPSPSPTPIPTCEGVQVTDLVADTEANGAGTTYCLAAGVYEIGAMIVLQEGDVLEGPPCLQATDMTVTCTAAIVWKGNTTSTAMFRGDGFFTVRDLEVSGALGAASCNPDCGRAFRPNQGADFIRIDCHDNANQCIGSGGKHVRVFDSEIHHNGLSPDFQDDARSAAGIKRVRGASLEVHNSYVHHNGWVGIWCDFCSSTYLIEGSIIEAAHKNGVSWEVSGGWNDLDQAVITGNAILGNNLSGTGAGITCNSCADLLIAQNVFMGNNGRAVMLIDAKRGDWGPITNVTIRDNTLGTDIIVGCNLAGVTCSGNT